METLWIEVWDDKRMNRREEKRLNEERISIYYVWEILQKRNRYSQRRSG